MCEWYVGVLILNPRSESGLFEQTSIEIHYILQEHVMKVFSMVQKKGIPFNAFH